MTSVRENKKKKKIENAHSETPFIHFLLFIRINQQKFIEN